MDSTTWKFTQNDLVTTGNCTSYGEQDHSPSTAELFEKVMPLWQVDSTGALSVVNITQESGLTLDMPMHPSLRKKKHFFLKSPPVNLPYA
jgi:hypothetical protein